MTYLTYMIVYSKNKPRLKNYNGINTIFNNQIIKFEAINTIDEFEHWKEFAIKNGYTTPHYINHQVLKEGKGKLGCNLSHQLLLQKIYQKYKEHIASNNSLEKSINIPKWYLILEDDVGIKKQNYQEINSYLNNLIAQLNDKSPNSKFVQLCIYDNFIAPQFSAPKIFDMTYKKIPQYGTCAYFIHIDAIEFIVKNKCISVNMDFFYNSIDKYLNSLASFNPYFYCKGSNDSNDSRKELGSLIWENKN